LCCPNFNLHTPFLDLDVNLFLRDHRKRVAIFIGAYFVVGALFTYFLTPAAVLMILPMIYCVLRFDQVLSMRPGYPLFSLLFAMSAWGFQAASTIYWVTEFSTQPDRPWPYAAVAAVFAAGFVWTLVAYRDAKSRGDSPTLQANAALFCFLFSVGVGDFTSRVLLHFYQDTPVNVPDFLFGPVHFIPTGLILFYRRAVHRQLGTRWLQRRVRDEGILFTSAEEERGELEEVERAMASNADLDELIRAESWDDSFSLLMYSAGNGFDDAVLRLLVDRSSNLSDIAIARKPADPNKCSRTMQRTATHFAAQNGHLAALTMLIEHGADANCADANGFHPIYLAALKGHVECVRLLLDHGAYGADLDQQVLLVAQGKNHTEVVELLLQEGGYNTQEWMGMSLENFKARPSENNGKARHSSFGLKGADNSEAQQRWGDLDSQYQQQQQREEEPDQVMFDSGNMPVLRASLSYQ
jgi:hypothetical protein